MDPQKAADALALVEWWFEEPGLPYCARCEKLDSLAHSFFRSKQAEMLEKARAALADLKAAGIVPADPNPF